MLVTWEQFIFLLPQQKCSYWSKLKYVRILLFCEVLCCFSLSGCPSCPEPLHSNLRSPGDERQSESHLYSARCYFADHKHLRNLIYHTANYGSLCFRATRSGAIFPTTTRPGRRKGFGMPKCSTEVRRFFHVVRTALVSHGAKKSTRNERNSPGW